MQAIRFVRWGVLALICCPVVSFGQTATAAAPMNGPGDALNASLVIVEHEFTSAAEAMPDDKYSFAPTTGDFKGVRTFGEQVKHVAAANYFFGSGVLGEKPPAEAGGDNGPDNLKTKAEIVKFLNDSFAYLHKALASVTAQNQMDQIDSPFGRKVPRLSLASFSLAHPMDHYGQMVVYLRMNGIVPPASRPQQGR